jgi:hypothetical protein
LFLTINNGRTVHAGTDNSDANNTEVQQTADSNEEVSKPATSETATSSGKYVSEASKPVADSNASNNGKLEASRGSTSKEAAPAARDKSSDSQASSASDSSQKASTTKRLSATPAASNRSAAKKLSDSKLNDDKKEDASATIIYREGSKEVGTGTITGKVDQRVDLTLNIPSSYNLVGWIYRADDLYSHQFSRPENLHSSS